MEKSDRTKKNGRITAFWDGFFSAFDLSGSYFNRHMAEHKLTTPQEEIRQSCAEVGYCFGMGFAKVKNGNQTR